MAGVHRGTMAGGRTREAPPPKGWMAIRVGGDGEEQHRFVVPVSYLNHPLFVALLRAAEEYGFDHPGAITIPYHVEQFRHVQGISDRDNSSFAAAVGHRQVHHFHLCFRA